MASAENIIVAMMHTNKRGESGLLADCTFRSQEWDVKKVVTNLATIEIKDGAFHLLERALGVTVDETRNATEGELVVPAEVPEMLA